MIYISSKDEIPVLLRCCTGSTKSFRMISARCHREFYHGTVHMHFSPVQDNNIILN